MFLEKFSKINALLKEARSVTTRLLHLKDPRTTHQIILLRRLLDQIQTSVISTQADFIEALFSDESPKIENSGLAAVRLFRRSNAEGTSGHPPLDRRYKNQDRRQLHTYIANDRRSGIADRRRKKPMRALRSERR